MIDSSLLKIYNASAGSGKTYTLVKEYLSIVLSSNDYTNFSKILAITFTNKAAAEMKDRIIKALKEFASEDSNDWDTDLFRTLCSELQLKPEQLNERAKKSLSKILHQYSNFAVSTIDKFTHRLIRSFSQDLGLSTNFEVEMDADKLLQESVEILLSKLGKDTKLTQSLVYYSLSKLDEDKSWNISLDLTDMAKILLKEDNQNYLKQLKNHTIDDFTKLRKSITNQQNSIKKELQSLSDSFFTLLQLNGIQFSSFAYRDLPNYFTKLTALDDFSKITIGKRLQKQLDTQQLYSKTTDSSQKVAIDSVFTKIHQLTTKSATYIEEKKETYLLNQLILRTISSLTVINEVEKELAALKEENNILLNSEFNQIISDEIRNQPAPYIYERIGEKYVHYFIDEFQDTSTLQWQNLKPLIENQLAQSGNALIVGDSKQSIYRWRGGDPEQFINLSANGEHLPFKTQNLGTNYRSCKEIIHFNNAFYQNASKSFENEAYKQLYSETTNQKTTTKDNGFIEVNLIDKHQVEDYNQTQLNYIYDTIKKLELEGFQHNEITILVRNNKHGIQIAQYLIENEIPIISKESLLLKNAIEIQLIEKLLQILHKENDYKTRVAFLLQLHQYKPLAIQSDLHSFIKNIIRLPLATFFEELKNIGIEFNFKEAQSKSLYDLVEYAYRQFQLIQKENNGYIQYFLDFIMAYTSRKSNNLNEFLHYWEEKKDKESIVTPSESNAVQIMTIHKSKGLQFPVVILPYADWEAFSDRKAHLWIPLNTPQYENFEHFYIPAHKNLADSKVGKELITQNNDQIQLDNVNLLYVATTRAVERLYIATLHQKETQKSSIAYYFNSFLDDLGIPKSEQFLYQCGNTIRQSKSIDSQYILPIQFHSNEWRSILEISKTAPLFWNIEKTSATEYGNRVHYVLSKIEYEHQVDSILQHLALTGFIPENQYTSIQEKIKQVVLSKDLNGYFKENYTVYNEREIFYNQQIIRPDRIVTQGKKAVIIDYKTGESNSEDKKQIQHYAQALEQLGYHVEKKLIVYIHESIQIVYL